MTDSRHSSKSSRLLFKDNPQDCLEVLKNAPIGIFTSSPQGRFLSVNPALSDMLGYDSPEKLIDSITHICSQIYADPEERDALEKLLNDHGQAANYECRWMRRDGSVVWVFNSIHAVRDESGSITHYQGFVLDINCRKQKERALYESEKRYRNLVESQNDLIVRVDPEYRFTYVNDTYCRFFGKGREELIGSIFTPLVYQEDVEETLEAMKKLWEPPYRVNILQRAKTVYGLRWILWEDSVVFGDNGEITEIQAVGRDVTQIKEAQQELEQKQEQLEKTLQELKEERDKMADLLNFQAEILSTAVIWINMLDEEGNVTFWNKAAENISGFRAEEVVGHAQIWEWLYPDPEYRASIMSKVKAIIQSGEKVENLETQVRTKNGQYRIISWYSNSLEKNGKMVGSIALGADVTEQRYYQEQLKHLSLHDQLTGLYNRAYLENELKRLNKSREHPVTIMSIDVDGLKAINDMFGHEQGDRILKLTADILQETFRASDILSRAGGDEFVALLPGTDAQAGSKIVQRIRSRVEKYNREKQDTQLPLSLSVGMAVAEDRSRDLFAVFKKADDLMYRDKLNKDVTARSQIMRTIMAALEERDFITHGHARRLEDLCRLLGESAGLSEKQLSDLALLAQVHDMGKVGIPDHVLFKEGPLTEDEWEIMYKHPEKGYRIAKASNDLAEIADLILKHHERWDGEGYPLGLEGEEIPVECRILAIADAYDAMTSDRPYRKALDYEDAIAELKRCSGTRFDPYLVDKFIEIIQQFNAQ